MSDLWSKFNCFMKLHFGIDYSGFYWLQFLSVLFFVLWGKYIGSHVSAYCERSSDTMSKYNTLTVLGGLVVGVGVYFTSVFPSSSFVYLTVVGAMSFVGWMCYAAVRYDAKHKKK